MKLVYITPCLHHVVLEDGNGTSLGLIDITHVTSSCNHWVINKTHEVTKESVEDKGLRITGHFIFLSNFCALQDNVKGASHG